MNRERQAAINVIVLCLLQTKPWATASKSELQQQASFLLDAELARLPAEPQPVAQEPVAFIFSNSEGSHHVLFNGSNIKAVHGLPVGQHPLYAAPPDHTAAMGRDTKPVAQEPYCIVYEWDAELCERHMSLSPDSWNGLHPNRALPLYLTTPDHTAATHLGSLLAVIHRDGGHYQDEHGTEKAVEDAMAKYYSLLTAIDRHTAAMRQALEALEKYPTMQTMEPEAIAALRKARGEDHG